MVDAGIAGEFAQADRFHTLRLEPLKRRVDKRFRQISMTKSIALRRRLPCHSPTPVCYGRNLSVLDGKTKFFNMSPLETIVVLVAVIEWIIGRPKFHRCEYRR